MSFKGTQGHWKGQAADPANYFGFIYMITHTPTGRKYIGKKQYYNAKKPPGCSRRVSDRTSKEWKEKCWGPSNWKEYKGSSPSLKKFMESLNDEAQFTYEILIQCRSKAILHYTECRMLFYHDVMQSKFEDGTFKYFNNSIPSIKFKIKEKLDDWEEILKIGIAGR